jgi:3'-phosphoadenosine 5'-phosphosulfate sulfotransferase (PAPS reductase)/FAD synthetase
MADTLDEQDETYAYVRDVFVPYLRRYGRELEVCSPRESVIGRWERLKVTGSRITRACTDHGKIRPMHRWIQDYGSPEDESIIGIDAGEAHRAREAEPGQRRKHYPLVDLDIDRDGCAEIIKAAGLPTPPKSGCWHCPFMRVSDILKLAIEHPDRMRRVIRLETVAAEARDQHLCQWNDTPAADYAKRACQANSSGPLFQEIDPDPPCGCYDG